MNYVSYLGSKPLLSPSSALCIDLADSLLRSLGCDSSCHTLILELNVFNVVSVACRWWSLCWICAFFPAVLSALEAAASVSWRWHWRDTHETPSQGWTGNCWALKLLAYQWNVSKCWLICFHSDSGFSRNYHNIGQGEFTQSFWSSLVSVEIHRLELWYRYLLTEFTNWRYRISLFQWFVFSPCFLGLVFILKWQI